MSSSEEEEISDDEGSTMEEEENEEFVQFGKIAQYIVNHPQYEGLQVVNTMRQQYIQNPNHPSITRALNIITNHVQMVLAGVATPAQFNIDFETVRNDREVRALMWLIVSGDIDKDNPLNAFIDTAYENKTEETDNNTYIDPFWPFVADDYQPPDNDVPRRKFLIDQVWTDVDYVAPQGKVQGRAGWHYGITDAGIAVKVRGQTRVQDPEDNTRATLETFLDEVKERRKFNKRIRKEQEMFYQGSLKLFGQRTLYTYVVTEDITENGKTYKRGQEISLSEVETKKIRPRYVARLVVLVRRIKSVPVYSEENNTLVPIHSRTLPLGQQLYESLENPIEIEEEDDSDDSDDDNNNTVTREYIKLYYKRKIKQKKGGALRYVLIPKTKQKYISPLPEKSLLGDSCVNYKDGEIVGRIPRKEYWLFAVSYFVPTIAALGAGISSLVSQGIITAPLNYILEFMFPICSNFERQFGFNTITQVGNLVAGGIDICQPIVRLEEGKYMEALQFVFRPLVGGMAMSTTAKTTSAWFNKYPLLTVTGGVGGLGIWSIFVMYLKQQLSFISLVTAAPNWSVMDLPLINKIKKGFVDLISLLLGQKNMNKSALSNMLSNITNVVLFQIFQTTKIIEIPDAITAFLGNTISIEGIRNISVILCFLNFMWYFVNNSCQFMLKMTKQLDNCNYNDNNNNSKKRPARLHREMLDSLVQLKF
jgi:hypothetical protein